MLKKNRVIQKCNNCNNKCWSKKVSTYFGKEFCTLQYTDTIDRVSKVPYDDSI